MALEWHVISHGAATETDWQKWLGTDRAIDPYLVWIDISRACGFNAQKSDRLTWPFLVELRGGSGQTFYQVPDGRRSVGPADATVCGTTITGAGVHPAFGLFSIPGAYKVVRGDRTQLWGRYFTAQVPICNVRELLKHGDLIERFQLGIPRIPQLDEVVTPRSPQPVSQNQKKQVVVGVIDDGFNFAHEQFRAGPFETRICYLWNQDALSPHDSGERVGVPHRVVDFGYGAEYFHRDLNWALRLDPNEAERIPGTQQQAYSRLDYFPRRPNPDTFATQFKIGDIHPHAEPLASLVPDSHGASALALLAGTDPPISTWDKVNGQVPASASDRDNADAWPIVCVQLPGRTTLDSSGGSLGVHILDGIFYILYRSQSIPFRDENDSPKRFFVGDELLPLPNRTLPNTGPDPTPTYLNDVIINISYGALAGPHDGTSILEQAITSVATDTPAWTMLFVIAAGNGRRSRTHARLELEEHGHAKSFRWTVGADNALEAYLEVWLPETDTEQISLGKSLLESLRIRLRPPAGAPECELKSGEGMALRLDGQQAVAAVIFARRVAQGTRGTMILIAMKQTRQPLAGDQATQPQHSRGLHGEWVVSLQWGLPTASKTKRRIAIHAWAERNDQLWGHGRPQQSWVVSDDAIPSPTEFYPRSLEFKARGHIRAYTDDVPRAFQPELSHSSLGLTWNRFAGSGALQVAHTSITVGGYRLSDSEMATYSGGGPTRGAPLEQGRLPGGAFSEPASCDDREVDRQKMIFNGWPPTDAPSDAGVALRGLRTIGFVDGQIARLGGTSAAAPLAARYMANRAYALAELNSERVRQNSLQQTPCGDDDPPAALSRRPTLTPTTDDRFFKGQLRIGPVRIKPS